MRMSNQPPEHDELKIERVHQVFSVSYRGEELARYRFFREQAKPYLYPLRLPGSPPLLEDSPPDHYHHHGIWIGHGEVNGYDFWLEHPNRTGRIEQHFVEEIVARGARVGFRVRNRWVAPDGRVPLVDVRSFWFTLDEAGDLVIDLTVTLWPMGGPVTLFGSNEAGIPHVRPARGIWVVNGGRIVNSAGGVNEAGTYGKEAEWVDYSGPVGPGGTWYGIAVFNHPGNPYHPAPWFTRDYGPFSPNFLLFTEPVVIQPERPYALSYRIVAHKGDHAEADVAGKYRRYLAELNEADGGTPR